MTALKLQDVDAYTILTSLLHRENLKHARLRRAFCLSSRRNEKYSKQSRRRHSIVFVTFTNARSDERFENLRVDDAEACQRHMALAQLPSLPTDVDSKTLSQWSRLLDCERYLLHQIDQLKFGLSDANLALT